MGRMTIEEREEFLAGLHVGMVAIADGHRGPLCVPVWYDYRPGGEVRFITGLDSRKGRLLAAGQRISLCAQTETPPYQYVSIEGPVVALDPVTDELVPMAVRYLGETQGRAYAAESAGAAAGGAGDVVVRVRPERWLAVDYGKNDA